METGNVSYNFDEIRPLNNDEVKEAIEELIANEDFARALRYIKPDLCWDKFAEAMRACKTKEEFKSTFGYDAVMTVAKKTTFSLTISGRSRLPKDKAACTFISNHRDIVLDVGFLNVMLYDVGYGPTQIAIGDNLLIRPWIKTLVRLCPPTSTTPSGKPKNPSGSLSAKAVRKTRTTRPKAAYLRC